MPSRCAMDLGAYLRRIGYERAPRADLDTLGGVLRAHVEAIPYENLDVQFARPVSRALPEIFAKIVEGRRGGWCYEMNGLFAWALREIGFEVSLLAGGVFRESAGDVVIGNHLVPIVDLGALFLADAGFGDGPFEPRPLVEGPFDVGPMRCGLSRIEDGWWRYQNDFGGGAPSFDFHPDVRDDSLLDARCRALQTDPASPFVLNAVVQRWRGGTHLSLRGRVLTARSGATRETRLVADAGDYVRTLRATFALDFEEAAALWPKIAARHEEVTRAASDATP